MSAIKTERRPVSIRILKKRQNKSVRLVNLCGDNSTLSVDNCPIIIVNELFYQMIIRSMRPAIREGTHMFTIILSRHKINKSR